MKGRLWIGLAFAAIVLLPSALAQVCNNGVWEPALGEKCDPTATPSGCAGVCRNTCRSCCGDGLIDQNEQCDGATWGGITSCQDLGFTGGPLACYPAGSGAGPGITILNECYFDVSGCTPALAPKTLCGDGVLDPDEECDASLTDRHPDGTTSVKYLRPGIRCSAFKDWTRGYIMCNPRASSVAVEAQCRARTNTCTRSTSLPAIPMTCPDVSLVNPGTPLAYVAKEGGVRPTDFGYTSAPDLVPCSDPDMDPGTPGLQPPTQTCAPGGTDCVYATEADQTGVPGGVGGRPLCVRPYLATGISYLYNARSQLIQCSTSNALCPKDFVHAASVPDPRTWPTATPTAACVHSTCGNSVLDPGEQCDGALVGAISTCADLGYAGGAVSCTGCVFDLSACTDGTPVAAQCGNGVLDAGEDCDWHATLDNLTLFRDGLRCSRFNNWNRGALRCLPQGTPGQCRADTSGCQTCGAAEGCTGTVTMKCGLPVILQKSPEIVAKVSGLLPGDPGYELADNWTACNANFTDPRVPGFPLPTPTATCNTLFDCVYANEAHPSNASPGANPTCYDSQIEEVIANAEGAPIQCKNYNNWCPKGFKREAYGTDNEGNPYIACTEEEKICDWGSDADGYEYGCNTLSGIFQNRLRCLNNFDGDVDPAPDPDGPPYIQICCPFKFSLGGGFRIFFGKDVKVY